MPTKKNILFVITKGNFGGAQRYVFDIASNLPKDEFSVSVAMGEGHALEQKLESVGIETIRIKSLKRNIYLLGDIQAFWELFFIFRLERPDIIHLNSSKAGLIGTIAARLASIVTSNYSPKIIFTGHGWAFNEKRNIISRAILSLLHYTTILGSHITIAVSERVRAQLAQFPFASKKIVTIHNGIKNDNYKDKNEARTQLALPLDKTIIGTISELHTNKGIDCALHACAHVFEEYPEVHFVILGDGEERKSLELLTKNLGIDSRVIFLGYVPHAAEYLKAFDIFSLTSRTEAFPYVLLEAGAASRPVIASRVGGIPELIEHQVSGLLSYPDDSDDIEHKMKVLLSDENKRNEYAQKLNQKVSLEFSLENMLEKTLVLYKK
jgi:glycosyltransferase involved in cell wall biosynthesis